MRLSILRCFLVWTLLIVVPTSLLGQNAPDQPAAAILHSQGGVWVNGYEARDSTAIFPGDILETKANAAANLVLDGTTVLLAPETVGKFQADIFELDHGSVSVGTTKSYKVRVNCLKVIPVANDWTQYVVTDVNRTVQVAAHKLDVNVEHEGGGQAKAAPQNEANQKASVHEGEEKNYDESEICGAAEKPSSPMSGVNPKWIAAGAGGAGILIWLLIHGGPKTPVSSATP